MASWLERLQTLIAPAGRSARLDGQPPSLFERKRVAIVGRRRAAKDSRQLELTA